MRDVKEFLGKEELIVSWDNLRQEEQRGQVDQQVIRFLRCAVSKTCSISQFILKYIQVLQTSKLCLLRQQSKKQILSYRLSSLASTLPQKSFIYLTLIQATIHSRYSQSPCFQYKIHPTSIPMITVKNQLNPVLNHQYTFQMERDGFQIYFYQSGVQIYQYKFRMDGLKEVSKSVSTEAITFEIRVKVMPKKSSLQHTKVTQQINKVEQTILTARKAFHSMCHYIPFMQQKSLQQYFPSSKLPSVLFSYFPFLQHHVQILHYILIFLLFIECLACLSSSVQFVDIIIIFVLIGILYDRAQNNVDSKLWVGFGAIAMATVKTVWVGMEGRDNLPKFGLVLVIAVIFKIITMFCIAITAMRAGQVSAQRLRYLYNVTFQNQIQLKKQQFIPIFKANQNFYINQKQVQNNR